MDSNFITTRNNLATIQEKTKPKSLTKSSFVKLNSNKSLEDVAKLSRNEKFIEPGVLPPNQNSLNLYHNRRKKLLSQPFLESHTSKKANNDQVFRTHSLSKISRNLVNVDVDLWLNNRTNQFDNQDLEVEKIPVIKEQVTGNISNNLNGRSELTDLIRVTPKRLESRNSTRQHSNLEEVYGHQHPHDPSNLNYPNLGGLPAWSNKNLVSGFAGHNPHHQEPRNLYGGVGQPLNLIRENSYEKYRPGSSFESLRSGINQSHIHYTTIALHTRDSPSMKLPPINKNFINNSIQANRDYHAQGPTGHGSSMTHAHGSHGGNHTNHMMSHAPSHHVVHISPYSNQSPSYGLEAQGAYQVHPPNYYKLDENTNFFEQRRKMSSSAKSYGNNLNSISRPRTMASISRKLKSSNGRHMIGGIEGRGLK